MTAVTILMTAPEVACVRACRYPTARIGGQGNRGRRSAYATVTCRWCAGEFVDLATFAFHDCRRGTADTSSKTRGTTAEGQSTTRGKAPSFAGTFSPSAPRVHG